jgi:ATP-dependent protease ClpP protease subunit
MRTWFTAKANNDNTAEIVIYDEIGLFGVTAADFRDELKALGNPSQIQVRINSPGGNIFDGITIHNMLARHKAEKIVTVDGIAASIASLIAMAGDQIIMPENAMMMIHNPEGVVIGTSKEMRDLAAALDRARDGMVATYARRSGLEHDEVKAIMNEETWLTADEAVDRGFADAVVEPVKIAARHDLSKFQKPPAALRVLSAEANMANANADPNKGKTGGAANADPNDPNNVNKPDGQAGNQVKNQSDKTNAPEPKTDDVSRGTNADPTAGAQKTVQQLVAEALQADRKQQADIIAACQLAGHPDKAAGFIAEGKGLSDVLGALQTLRASGGNQQQTQRTAPAAGGGQELNARHNATEPTGATADSMLANMKKLVEHTFPQQARN